MTKRFLRLAGLMSGTSMDGVDAALLTSNGEDVAALGQSLTLPYPQNLRRELQRVVTELSAWSRQSDFRFDRRWILAQSESFTTRIEALERDLTLSHAECLQQLLARGQGENLDLIGFHGHTILHQPTQKFTWQLGDGDLLAEIMQTPVMYDFRKFDVAAGGEGAPLVPIYHRARVQAANLPRPLAIVNIGGVANITWIGEDSPNGAPHLVAFDTGPGVALLDDFVRAKFGLDYDQDGRLASQGHVIEPILSQFLAADWFDRPPPKSLDREAWRHLADALLPDAGFAQGHPGESQSDHPSLADKAATLAAFTARAIALSLRHLPQLPHLILLAGGGRRHKLIMTRLARDVAAIDPAIICRDIDHLGWDGDGFEAEAFGFLAVRCFYDLPISFPGTTNAPKPLSGGVLAKG
ncbi:MAG: anhydro-N-acetylmuramic acid kinase [Candidatus Symbiobacter sp.]|nr:anhydro-N-acetylmuramic acid kinase [Candidatus Symbiobacter sp.]